MAVVAEGEIVHRPLRPGQDAERAEQGVGHDLAGFDIPCDHGGGKARAQHRAFGNADGDGFEAPVVHRHGFVDQRAHDIEDGGAHDGGGGVEIIGQLVGRAVEVDGRGAGGAIDMDSELDSIAAIHRIVKLPVGQAIDQAADGGFGLILHMAHIGRYRFDSVTITDAAQFARPLGAGGDLRGEVGDILVDIAGGPGAGGQQVADGGFAKRALIDQQQIVEDDALFLHADAAGRHGAGRDAADIGMMATRRDIEARRTRPHENRHDERDVGQMGAAIIRGVERIDVARQHAAPVDRLSVRAPIRDNAAPAHDRADAVTHAAEVDGHVRRVGDQIAGRVEQGAGEIQPFPNIDRRSTMLKRGAHFLSYRHEQAAHHLQPDGIDAGGVTAFGLGTGDVAGEDEVAMCVELRPPARFDRRGGDRVDDERGAIYQAVCR